MQRASVLLVDDHALMCQGLRAMLEPEYHVVGEVHDGEGVPDAVERLHPDVILIDLSLPGKSGTDVLLDLLTRPHPPAVVVLTTHVDRALADYVLSRGAHAFVPKDTTLAELRQAIEAARVGRRFLSPSVVHLPHAEAARYPPGYAGLTSREQQVVQMIGLGLKNDRIASQLKVSYRTVHFHRSNIRRKLGFHTEWEMTRFALHVREWRRHRGRGEAEVT